jgi:hypothetical protein
LCLESLDILAQRDACDDTLELAHPIAWDELADIPADDLVLAISIQPLGSGVPIRDDAVKVLADDRILRRCDDCREARRVVEGLARVVEACNTTEGTESNTSRDVSVAVGALVVADGR